MVGRFIRRLIRSVLFGYFILGHIAFVIVYSGFNASFRGALIIGGLTFLLVWRLSSLSSRTVVEENAPVVLPLRLKFECGHEHVNVSPPIMSDSIRALTILQAESIPCYRCNPDKWMDDEQLGDNIEVHAAMFRIYYNSSSTTQGEY